MIKKQESVVAKQVVPESQMTSVITSESSDDEVQNQNYVPKHINNQTNDFDDQVIDLLLVCSQQPEKPNVKKQQDDLQLLYRLEAVHGEDEVQYQTKLRKRRERVKQMEKCLLCCPVFVCAYIAFFTFSMMTCINIWSIYNVDLKKPDGIDNFFKQANEFPFVDLKAVKDQCPTGYEALEIQVEDIQSYTLEWDSCVTYSGSGYRRQCYGGYNHRYKYDTGIVTKSSLQFGALNDTANNQVVNEFFRLCAKKSKYSYFDLTRPNTQTNQCPSGTVPCSSEDQDLIYQICSPPNQKEDFCPINGLKVFTKDTFEQESVNQNWVSVMEFTLDQKMVFAFSKSAKGQYPIQKLHLGDRPCTQTRTTFETRCYEDFEVSSRYYCPPYALDKDYQITGLEVILGEQTWLESVPWVVWPNYIKTKACQGNVNNNANLWQKSFQGYLSCQPEFFQKEIDVFRSLNSGWYAGLIFFTILLFIIFWFSVLLQIAFMSRMCSWQGDDFHGVHMSVPMIAQIIMWAFAYWLISIRNDKLNQGIIDLNSMLAECSLYDETTVIGSEIEFKWVYYDKYRNELVPDEMIGFKNLNIQIWYTFALLIFSIPFCFIPYRILFRWKQFERLPYKGAIMDGI